MEMMTQTSKKLTKIKLVNWHYFTNETIDIKDSTLFTGENGSGKSTTLSSFIVLLIIDINKSDSNSPNSENNISPFDKGAGSKSRL